MPEVDGKYFEYGPEGEGDARRYAKKKGKRVTHKRNPHSYTENIMNDKQYELIGESIWDTYRSMAYLLSEVSLEWLAKRAESGFNKRRRTPKRPDDASNPDRDQAMKRIRKKLGARQGYDDSPESRTFQRRFFAHVDARGRQAPAFGQEVTPAVSPESEKAKRKQTDPSPLAQRKVRPELAGTIGSLKHRRKSKT